MLANPIRVFGVAHLYFIAHLAKSMSEEEKESGSVANVDSNLPECPEMERTGESFWENS